MFKIKAKPGYNVLIKDLGLTLRSENNNWYEIDESVFNNSVDVQKVKSLLIIENLDGVENIVTETKNDNVETTFVARPRFEANPPDVFVKDVENIEEPKEVVKEVAKEVAKEVIKEVDEKKVEETKVEETELDVTPLIKVLTVAETSKIEEIAKKTVTSVKAKQEKKSTNKKGNN